MAEFGVVEYVVCAAMVIASGAIGLAYSIWSKKKESPDANTAARSLMGSKHMSVLPITSSLVMSMFSGVALQSVPGEVFTNGGSSLYFLPWSFLNGLLNNYVTLPIFYNLKLVTVYEYLEKRYDRRVRLMMSFLKLFHLITRNTMTVFGSAMIFEQVSGVNIHATSAFICIICTFYTIAGGFKAVIWADTVQALITVIGLMTVMIKGTMDVGGLNTLWRTNVESGRLDFPSFNVDFTIRFTFWAGMIGHPIMTIQSISLGQDVVQRYMALPTLRKAKLTSWYYIIGSKLCWLVCLYIGLLVYTTFHDCDPIASKQIRRLDELWVLLVTTSVGGYTGLPGLLAATLFSLCLSTFSTGLNTVGLIVLEDFVRHKYRNISNKNTGIIIVITIICAAAISFGLVFLVQTTKLILPLNAGLGACSAGPTITVFLGGMLLPWMNKQGALYGGIIGFCVTAVTVFGSQFSYLKKEKPLVRPATVDGCPAHWNISLPAPTSFTASAAAATAMANDSYVFPLFKLNFYWYCVYGVLVSIVPAMVISLFTGMTDLSEMDEKLLAPLARKFLPEKKNPEELESIKENAALENP